MQACHWTNLRSNNLTRSIFLTAILILICIFTNTGCTKEYSKGKNMSLLQEKPVFEIKISAFGVKYFVEVNGISVLSELDPDGQVSLTLPINHWMRSGENTIGISAFPNKEKMPFNSRGYVKIDLTVRELSKKGKTYTVATLHFSGKKDENQSHTGMSSPSGIYASTMEFQLLESGDINVVDPVDKPMIGYEGAILFERKINIPSSLPLWKFFISEKIPDYTTIENENEYDRAMAPLFKEYEKLQNALSNRKVEPILSMFEERNQEIDMAFYLEPGTTAADLRESLLSAAGNKDLELLGLSIDNVNWHLEDNGKLVSLRRYGLDHAIILNYVNEKKAAVGSRAYPMYFRLQDGKWILTR